MKSKLGLVASVLFLTAMSSTASSQEIIPADRRIDWSHAGIPGGIPNRKRIGKTIDSATYGNGSTDASSAINTAIKNCQILDNAYGVIGIEIMGAAQALDFREYGMAPGTAAAHAVIRKHVEHLDEDRPLYPDHTTMKALVRSCEILDAVESAVGSLG